MNVHDIWLFMSETWKNRREMNVHTTNEGVNGRRIGRTWSLEDGDCWHVLLQRRPRQPRPVRSEGYLLQIKREKMLMICATYINIGFSKRYIRCAGPPVRHSWVENTPIYHNIYSTFKNLDTKLPNIVLRTHKSLCQQSLLEGKATVF